MKRAFDSLTSALRSQRKTVHEVCRLFSKSPSKGNLKRLKSLFSQCGEQVYIEAGFHCDYAENIYLGDRVFINTNCTFIDSNNISELEQPLSEEGKEDKEEKEDSGAIIIGNDCLIGPNVQLLAVSHDMAPKQRELHKYNYAQGITLQKNVWLSAGVIVLAGVTIGENSVIGAGSVVTKNVDANSFYAGNPAVKIRTL